MIIFMNRIKNGIRAESKPQNKIVDTQLLLLEQIKKGVERKFTMNKLHTNGPSFCRNFV